MTVIIKEIGNGFIVALVNNKEEVEEYFQPDEKGVLKMMEELFTPQETYKEPPKIKDEDVPRPPPDVSTKKPTWTRPKPETM